MKLDTLSVLLDIYSALKPAEKRNFAVRSMIRDKMKNDLATHSATLDAAIEKINVRHSTLPRISSYYKPVTLMFLA